MRNRLPTYPGRVRLAPVEGQANVFDLTRADEPQDPGTPLNKGTLLSDDVEALIWGAAADRTPNDAFGKVSELYQYWWAVADSVGETTYVHSPDRNAYPDSGTVDGLTYKYLGVPFENARTAKGFKKIGEGKILASEETCYVELEQNLQNYSIVIIDGSNLRGNRDTGTAAIVTVLSVESLTAKSGNEIGKLLTAYSSYSARNNFSVAFSGITTGYCVYLWRNDIGSGFFRASPYLYFKSDYDLLDEATFTVWGVEK